MAAFTPMEAAVEAVAGYSGGSGYSGQPPKHLPSQQRLPAQALPMEAPALGIAQLCSTMEMGIETETEAETVAPARHPVILLAL